MDEQLKALSDKLDKVLENQELILKQLAQSTILTKEPVATPKRLSKKEAENQRVQEYMLIIQHRRRLQVQFNLALPPHHSRILQYLRTNDDSVFDGLRRNK